MSDFAIPEAVRRANKPVFLHTVGGRSVWVKQTRRWENPLGWWAQRLLYGATGLLLLLPPERPTGNRIAHEADRLEELAALGAPVPPVLHREADYFVMGHCGPSLVQFLDGNDDAPAWIERAITALRDFHRLGQAHGGAQIKNLTVHDGRIHFIDFEERLPADKTAAFQLRDLFLFFLSLEKRGHDPDLPRLCRVYAGDEWPGLWARLREALGQVRVVRWCEWRGFSSLSMRDIRSLGRLVAKAQGAGAGTI